MSDVSRRKVDGNDVFLLPNRRIRPNSTKMSTILLNFVDQSSIAFGARKAGAATRKSGHGTQKSRRGTPKIPPYQLKAPPEIISEGAGLLISCSN